MSRRFGTAGSAPTRMARAWRARQAASLVPVAIAVVGMLRWDLPAATLAVCLIAAAVVWSIGEGRVARARSGASAERDVADRLRGFGTVVYGWRPPGVRFDVDLVVLEPSLAAVEVKRAEGRLRVRSDGTVLVGGRPIPGDPLRQAVRSATFVRKAVDADETVPAVLCITGMRQRPRVLEWSGSEVVVCSTRHLRRVLRRLEPRRSRHQARQMAVALNAPPRQ